MAIASKQFEKIMIVQKIELVENENMKHFSDTVKVTMWNQAQYQSAISNFRNTSNNGVQLAIEMGEKKKQAICKINSLVEPPQLHSDLFFALLTPNTKSVMLKPNVYGFKYRDSTGEFEKNEEDKEQGMESSGKKKEFYVKEFED